MTANSCTVVKRNMETVSGGGPVDQEGRVVMLPMPPLSSPWRRGGIEGSPSPHGPDSRERVLLPTWERTPGVRQGRVLRRGRAARECSEAFAAHSGSGSDSGSGSGSGLGLRARAQGSGLATRPEDGGRCRAWRVRVAARQHHPATSAVVLEKRNGTKQQYGHPCRSDTPPRPPDSGVERAACTGSDGVDAGNRTFAGTAPNMSSVVDPGRRADRQRFGPEVALPFSLHRRPSLRPGRWIPRASVSRAPAGGRGRQECEGGRRCATCSR